MKQRVASGGLRSAPVRQLASMGEIPARWYEIQLHRVVVPAEVVFRVLAHETVLLNIRTGKYHGIDAIGARFFDTARDSANVKAACDALAREYGQEDARVRTDLVAFVDAMERRGLLQLQEPSAAAPT
jgi:hypothetical protein